MDTGMEKAPARVARRVRHELRFRQLDVTRVEDITPAMRRITLAGPDLAGFTSLSFDDHVKLFFPGPDAPMALPVAGLMSLEPFVAVRDRLAALRAAALSLGVVLEEPFLQLAFLALPVIPHLKITDMGMVDVDRFEIIP